jgi:mannitol/fructose-specific phosphotransferase system IIA component
MADTHVIRWLSARFAEKTRSMFSYIKGIGHWRPKENPELVEVIFSIAAADARHTAALAHALDRMGVVPPGVSPVDLTHLHYMRPEFLLPIGIREKERSVEVLSRPEAMAYPTIAPIAIAIAADDRRHLELLGAQHLKVAESAAADAAAAEPV